MSYYIVNYSSGGRRKYIRFKEQTTRTITNLYLLYKSDDFTKSYSTNKLKEKIKHLTDVLIWELCALGYLRVRPKMYKISNNPIYTQIYYWTIRKDRFEDMIRQFSESKELQRAKMEEYQKKEVISKTKDIDNLLQRQIETKEEPKDEINEGEDDEYDNDADLEEDEDD